MSPKEFDQFIAKNVKHNPIEASILNRLRKDLEAAGDPIVMVFDGEEETPVKTYKDIKSQVFNLDECFLNTAKGHWVRFVLGNEQDCLVDHHVTLSPVLDPIYEWASDKWD
jgi:hypothetical protein